MYQPLCHFLNVLSILSLFNRLYSRINLVDLIVQLYNFLVNLLFPPVDAFSKTRLDVMAQFFNLIVNIGFVRFEGIFDAFNLVVNIGFMGFKES